MSCGSANSMLPLALSWRLRRNWGQDATAVVGRGDCAKPPGWPPEDAMVLALGTFGTDQTGAILGAHAVVTYDQSLVNGYHNRMSALRRRLGAIQAQLSSPFNRVTLPSVVLPDDFLDSLL